VFNYAKGLQGFSAYPLGRRISGQKLRILRLQLLQLPQQHIILCVADFRAIQHVVAVVVMVDLGF